MITPLITGSSASYSYGSGGSVAVVRPRANQARVSVRSRTVVRPRTVVRANFCKVKPQMGKEIAMERRKRNTQVAWGRRKRKGKRLLSRGRKKEKTRGKRKFR